MHDVVEGVAEVGVDGRRLPQAAYLAGLAGVEGPVRRIFMDPKEQRRRFLEAVRELMVDREVRDPNIGDVAERAGLTRWMFARHFDGLEDCVRVALVEAEAELRDRVGAVLRSVGSFYDRLAAATAAVVAFAGDEPLSARLAVAESFGEQAVRLPGYGEDFGALRAWLVSIVGTGGSGAPGSVQQEAMIGVVETLVASCLRDGDGSVGVDLAREVTYFLVSAFAGLGGFGSWCSESESDLEVCDVVSR